MNERELWARAQEVFEQILGAENHDADLLDELCRGDGALRSKVLLLLDADRDLAPLPTQRAPEVVAEIMRGEFIRSFLGRKLGAYRVVEELGDGGMGIVYLAHRDDAEFDKKVAIKIQAPGLETEPDLRRFRAERQILAKLEHPNICRLLDGGTTDEGGPFLVMEYVEGVPITSYCDAKVFTIWQRIDLLLPVCEAVHYAHRNLVIHRDLKSSNILVTAAGQPKLLDFGIALLLSSAETADVEPEGKRLTPDYASPEQVTGGAITTATDVYSLGILLYELICGDRPFDHSSSSNAERAQRILEQKPAAPSQHIARLTAERAEATGKARGVTATKLGRHIPEDLDAIVLRTLEKAPEKRYGSVEDLSRDLRRYLADRPVEVYSSSWSYRLGKFFRRNPVAAWASSTALLLFLAFIAGTWIQAREVARQRDAARHEAEIAQHEKKRAEAVTRFLVSVFEQADPSRARAGRVAAREILENGARQIRREMGGQPELRATLLFTLGKVFNGLGLYEQAEELLDESLSLRRQTFEGQDRKLAETLYEKGLLALRQGRAEDAEKRVQEATALNESIGEALSAKLRRLLGAIRELEGRRQEAIDLQREAVTLDRRLKEEHPQRVTGLLSLGAALVSRGRLEEAGQAFREGLDLQERYRPGDQTMTATLLRELGGLERRARNLDKARELTREAVEMNRRLYGERHTYLAESLNSLGILERRAGRPGIAQQHLEESLSQFRHLLGDEHPRIAGLLLNLGKLWHRDLDRLDRAEPLLREAVELFRRATADRSPNHPNLAFLLVEHGAVLNSLDRHQDAEPLLREALRIWQHRGQGGKRNGSRAGAHLAECLLGLGRAEEAEQLFLGSYEYFSANPDKSDDDLPRILRGLVELASQTGRLELSRRYRERLDEVLAGI